MTVKRENDELVVRIKVGSGIKRVQRMLNYLHYEELTANAAATNEELEELLAVAKSERLARLSKDSSDHE